MQIIRLSPSTMIYTRPCRSSNMYQRSILPSKSYNLNRYCLTRQPWQVKAKSREAFRFLPRSSTSPSKGGDGDVARMSRGPLKNAVNALTSDLKGVGPATASAVLAAACSGCPFDADEVWL